MKRVFKQSLFFVFCGGALFAGCSSENSANISHAPPEKSVDSTVAPSKPKWQQDVDVLDVEIQRLTNQRNLHLAKATRLQNQGDRLQFNRNSLLEARLAWQQAEINREIAEKIDQEIVTLNRKRAAILKSKGVKEYPSKKKTTTNKANN